MQEIEKNTMLNDEIIMQEKITASELLINFEAFIKEFMIVKSLQREKESLVMTFFNGQSFEVRVQEL